MNKQIKDFLKQNSYILIILFFSLIIRIYYSATHVSFSQDVARDLLIMEKFKTTKVFFVEYGPKASVGNFYLPPFYYQLHYFLSLITNFYPFIMKCFITLVEAFTPIIICKILSKLFEKKTAFISSLIYVFANLVIIYATSEWNPNMIPFLSTLALYFWLEYLQNNKTKYIIYALFTTTIAFQLHYQVAVLAPFCLLVLIISLVKNPKHYKYWVLGIVLCLLTFLPYIVAEVQNNYVNTLAIIKFFTQEHTRYFDRISKPDYIFNFYPQFIEKVLFNNNYKFFIFGRVIFYLGFIRLLYLAIKKRRRYLYLFLYFLFIFIMMRIYKGDKVDYYLSTLYIFPSILIAGILSCFKKFKKLSLGFILIIVFFCGVNLAMNNYNNEYLRLKETIIKLSQSVGDNKVRLQFFNNDYVNVFAYGIKNIAAINLDKESKLIVDVCDDKDIRKCIWNGESNCKYSRGYVYSSLVKGLLNNYRYLTTIKTNDNGYTLIVGKVEKINYTNYPISIRDQAYGSDYLLDGIIY